MCLSRLSVLPNLDNQWKVRVTSRGRNGLGYSLCFFASWDEIGGRHLLGRCEDSSNTPGQQRGQKGGPQRTQSQERNVFCPMRHQGGDAADENAHARHVHESTERIGQGREGPGRERRGRRGLHSGQFEIGRHFGLDKP